MKRKITTIVFAATLFFSTSCKDNKTIEPIPNLTVTDIDSNIYHTVKIGTQVWMVENLKVLRYRNGDSIPNIFVDNSWDYSTTGAYRDYLDNSSNGNTYGHLYNWYAVADSRKIAPVGWHVPTRTEWTTLIDYLGGSELAGAKLKETKLAHWTNPNTGATNASGFTALPGGAWALGFFGGIGEDATWWTATDWSQSGAYYWWVNYDNTLSSWNSWKKSWGCSVRCVQD